MNFLAAWLLSQPYIYRIGSLAAISVAEPSSRRRQALATKHAHAFLASRYVVPMALPPHSISYDLAIFQLRLPSRRKADCCLLPATSPRESILIHAYFAPIASTQCITSFAMRPRRPTRQYRRTQTCRQATSDVHDADRHYPAIAFLDIRAFQPRQQHSSPPRCRRQRCRQHYRTSNSTSRVSRLLLLASQLS